MNYNFSIHKAIKARFGTQIRFAKEIGVDPSSLSLWINGWREPNEAQKQLLADALNVRVDQLFDNCDETS